MVVDSEHKVAAFPLSVPVTAMVYAPSQSVGLTGAAVNVICCASAQYVPVLPAVRL